MSAILRRAITATAVAVVGLVLPAVPAGASPPSGAIFTTLPDGSEVNFNIYDDKRDVYLDGGPGIGAPQTAAGLDDGDYYFQVTDPGSKNLLSTDAITCRRFTVSAGLITSVAPSGTCAHNTGLDVDHGAVTVQLFPYADTPNPGGEYKVWVTRVENYQPGSGKFGFVPGNTKTDNFKVGSNAPMEIDTRFWRDGLSDPVDGLGITWTDTNGAQNTKWSYWAPEHQVFHEAHVENVEVGTHQITIDNQSGCTVGDVSVAGRYVGSGPRTLAIAIKRQLHTDTVFVDVDCV